MRKVWAVVLFAVVLAITFSVNAEVASFSKLELDTYQEKLLRTAIEQNEFFHEVYDGTDAMMFDGFTLLTDSDKLTVNTEIYELIMNEPDDGEEALEDVRGLKIGDSLEKLLSAFPLGNDTLTGTREDAVLYIEGELPGQVAIGYLVRDGQKVEAVYHYNYSMTNGGVKLQTVEYKLDGNTICGIRYNFRGDVMSLKDAQSDVDIYLGKIDNDEYISVLPNETNDNAAPFGREDLIFSEMDLLTLTPEQAEAVLGDEHAEEWINDEEDFIRVMEWNAAEMTFLLDTSEESIELAVFMMNEDKIEGPRGIRVGDEQESVLSRFKFDANGTDSDLIYLYGSEESGEYAVADYIQEGQMQVYYCCVIDGKTAGMTLVMEDAKLTEIIITID